MKYSDAEIRNKLAYDKTVDLAEEYGVTTKRVNDYIANEPDCFHDVTNAHVLGYDIITQSRDIWCNVRDKYETYMAGYDLYKSGDLAVIAAGDNHNGAGGSFDGKDEISKTDGYRELLIRADGLFVGNEMTDNSNDLSVKAERLMQMYSKAEHVAELELSGDIPTRECNESSLYNDADPKHQFEQFKKSIATKDIKSLVQSTKYFVGVGKDLLKEGLVSTTLSSDRDKLKAAYNETTHSMDYELMYGHDYNVLKQGKEVTTVGNESPKNINNMPKRQGIELDTQDGAESFELNL